MKIYFNVYVSKILYNGIEMKDKYLVTVDNRQFHEKQR